MESAVNWVAYVEYFKSEPYETLSMSLEVLCVSVYCVSIVWGQTIQTGFCPRKGAYEIWQNLPILGHS